MRLLLACILACILAVLLPYAQQAQGEVLEENIVKETELSRKEIKNILLREFKNSPIMVDIASCESRYQQYNDDGTVLRGKGNKKDVGLFQINEYWHLKTSEKMGIDIYTLSGNIEYARYLYKKNGTRDWNWSKPMWRDGECEYE